MIKREKQKIGFKKNDFLVRCSTSSLTDEIIQTELLMKHFYG